VGSIRREDGRALFPDAALAGDKPGFSFGVIALVEQARGAVVVEEDAGMAGIGGMP
jgi:hypothetical protein